MTSLTLQFITKLTSRNAIRFTEMRYVVVAVFESGRPSFISKAKLTQLAQVADASDREALALLGEWKIKGQSPRANKLEALEKRICRAGFKMVNVYPAGEITAQLPDDEFDAVVARQIAKENGWKLSCAGRLSVAA